MENQSEKSSANEEEEDELDSGNNDNFVPPKPSRAVPPRNKRANIIGHLPQKPRRANSRWLNQRKKGLNQKILMLAKERKTGYQIKHLDLMRMSIQDISLIIPHPTYIMMKSSLSPPPPSPSPAVTPPHQPESSSTPLEQQIAIGLQLEAASIIKSRSMTVSGLASSEGSQILAASLALTPDERKSALDISHNDLVAFFKHLAGSNKKSLKRSNVKYVLSPKWKRIHKYT